MKVFIGYISLSGNTEKMAVIIKDRLAAAGCKVEMERLDRLETDTLKDYDLVFIGSYTWNKDELPYEAIEFYEELGQADVYGVKVACFGSDDLSYTNAYTAIDMLLKKMKDHGSNVYGETLKIHQKTTTYNQIKRCEDFADQVLMWSTKRKKWRLFLRSRALNILHYAKPASL
ncbi:flavodoxin domain-containing protein [Bacillus cihuensis]|uniref:flavodoxin domain-containing protein n=1 Tax=Bacillus cihuensis TaxID=1208599 RepID=UPI00041377BC|nr:flavodoxin domain-containing protein [Bacillus cihuensis]